MLYAQITDGQVSRTRGRPNWRDDAGTPVTDGLLADYGILPVEDVRPDFDPLTHRLIQNPREQWAVEDTRAIVTYTVEPRPLAEVIEARCREVDAHWQAVMEAGFAHDFGDKTATLQDGSTEPAGVRVLQTGREIDRANWQAVAQAAAYYIGQGLPDEPMRVFRTLDNARVPMTAGEAWAVLLGMQAHLGAAQETRWNHKDALRSAASVEAVVAYDIGTGWPG